MHYMYTLRLRSTNFPKTLRPFQKPRWQKSDIKEVHNLKFRHCLDVVGHTTWKYLQYVCHLTQSCKWLSLLGKLEIQSPYAFWKLHTLLLWKKIKHDIITVSKSVAWYQKYMHIKVCAYSSLPSNRYTPRAWREVKMMFIPANGKVTYTQAKAYCPITLPSFMQKMMQNF